MSNSPDKQSDRLVRLKYIAWCRSQLPPEGTPMSFEDFIEYARFQLSVEKRVLMKDPIWDRYSDEDVLVEYYATVFEKSDDARKDFRQILDGAEGSDFLKWAEQQEKTAAPVSGETAVTPDEVDFDPEDLKE